MDNNYLKTAQEMARETDNAFKFLYDSGMNICQIGKKFGISRERVRQRLARVGYKRRFVTRMSKEEKITYRLDRRKAIFYSKLLINGECLEFTGHVNKKTGYGTFGLAQFKERYAHRVAYLFSHGSIPDGACVLHHCDNPKCCNPDHIYLGDYKQNAIDRETRGRGNHSFRRGPREINLTRNAEILSSFTSGVKAKVLSKKYNLSTGHVYHIVANARKDQLCKN